MYTHTPVLRLKIPRKKKNNYDDETRQGENDLANGVCARQLLYVKGRFETHSRASSFLPLERN